MGRIELVCPCRNFGPAIDSLASAAAMSAQRLVVSLIIATSSKNTGSCFRLPEFRRRLASHGKTSLTGRTGVDGTYGGFQ
jgi:hypothetical protein